MQIVIVLLIFTILISFIIFSLRFSWWRKNITYEYPRVLMYHMVSKHLPKNKSKFNRLRVEPKEFEKQIKWLSKNGFKSYFVREISDDLPPKSVIITFDDGYKDNLTNALPILQKYGFKATIFIVCNRFDKNWATDKDLKKSSDELNNEKMLSDEDVKKLLESGLIEIGSHTLNHANLPSLSYKDKQNEILNSKLEIEKISYTETDFTNNTEISLPEQSKYNSVQSGERIVYEIRVKNTSNVVAKNIKIIDKILCNKYQNDRSTLLVYIKRLVIPDMKTNKAIIQPIIAVVVKGCTKRKIPISSARIPDHSDKRFIIYLLIIYHYITIFFVKRRT